MRFFNIFQTKKISLVDKILCYEPVTFANTISDFSNISEQSKLIIELEAMMFYIHFHYKGYSTLFKDNNIDNYTLQQIKKTFIDPNVTDTELQELIVKQISYYNTLNLDESINQFCSRFFYVKDHEDFPPVGSNIPKPNIRFSVFDKQEEENFKLWGLLPTALVGMNYAGVHSQKYKLTVSLEKYLT